MNGLGSDEELDIIAYISYSGYNLQIDNGWEFPSVVKRLFSFLFDVAKKLLFLIKKELNSPTPLLRQLICNEGHLKSAFGNF